MLQSIVQIGLIIYNYNQNVDLYNELKKNLNLGYTFNLDSVLLLIEEFLNLDQQTDYFLMINENSETAKDFFVSLIYYKKLF